jgi:DUF4097 and DUF4098 domain-containing protein YvlB
MPSFPTPEPITLDVEVAAGLVHVTTADRDETVVDVRPRDAARPGDVSAAEQTRVEFRHNRLTVKTPMPWIMLGRRASVDIEVALPTNSRLNAAVASAGFHAEGRYAECRLSSASGDVSVESVHGNIKADSASGAISVGHVVGAVSVSTASGDAVVGDLHGDLRFQTASGRLTVDRLHGHLNCQSASGGATVTTAVEGGVSMQTASGELTVGIPEGTAAQLDLRTRSGAVTNTLQPADGPAAGDHTLAVHARTASGDITIHRTAPAVSAE